MTDPLQCRDYCRGTAGCFGFVWAPAESKCWLKTGDKARYVKTNWSYNDIHSKGSDGGLYMLDTSCDSLTGYNREYRVGPSWTGTDNSAWRTYDCVLQYREIGGGKGIGGYEDDDDG